jgi:hypothetical protein
MASPIPKDPTTRQRRNKTSTNAILPAEGQVRRRVPRMPEHPRGRTWHPEAVAWWRSVWHSPMASEYLEADAKSLRRLLVLIDDFWVEPTEKLEHQISQSQQTFGITPIDRRRLQWTVEKVEQGQSRRPAEKPARSEPVDDPRQYLRAVQ